MGTEATPVPLIASAVPGGCLVRQQPQCLGNSKGSGRKWEEMGVPGLAPNLTSSTRTLNPRSGPQEALAWVRVEDPQFTHLKRGHEKEV